MFKQTILSPIYVSGFISLTCFAALAAAFIAEVFLNLEPCRLCIYQRYPFAIGFVLGLLGITLRHHSKAVISILAISALTFVINAAIALYHTGVEQDWWISTVEGCTITFAEDSESQSVLDNIMSAPMGDCSEIPWQDPIFGLSMANWNIPFCLGLSLLCLVTIITSGRDHGQASSNSESQ